jgi:hypothetical protein
MNTINYPVNVIQKKPENNLNVISRLTGNNVASTINYGISAIRSIKESITNYGTSVIRSTQESIVDNSINGMYLKSIDDVRRPGAGIALLN